MKPPSIGAEALRALLERELVGCSYGARQFFATVAFDPVRWNQSPCGDETGGFWAVAAKGDRVLWYNHIEEGFNVSRFDNRGEIPRNEYWCNQDNLCTA